MLLPIPLPFIGRILQERRNVLVKYVTWTTGLRLVPKQKIVFYASQDSKEIVGEGIIEIVEFLTASEALEKYGERIFLSKGELEKYMMLRPNRASKKMLVLMLSKLREYTPHVKYGRPITMAGQYLTREEYSELFHKSSRPKGALL
jgi:hypothetical protein